MPPTELSSVSLLTLPRACTLRALAERLGVPLRRVRRWAAKGALPTITVCGARLVDLDALGAKIEQAEGRDRA